MIEKSNLTVEAAAMIAKLRGIMWILDSFPPTSLDEVKYKTFAVVNADQAIEEEMAKLNAAGIAQINELTKDVKL